MRTTSFEIAIKIASDWHSGQWSALYSFASSAIINPHDLARYLSEIEGNIEKAGLTRTQAERLEKLKRFFVKEATHLQTL